MYAAPPPYPDYAPEEGVQAAPLLTNFSNSTPDLASQVNIIFNKKLELKFEIVYIINFVYGYFCLVILWTYLKKKSICYIKGLLLIVCFFYH